MKRTQNEDNWNIAKHLRNVVNFNIRQAKADYIITELDNGKNDPKKFWRTNKKVFPNKNNKSTRFIKLKDLDGEDVPERDIPDFINTFFIKIGQQISDKQKSEATAQNSHKGQNITQIAKLVDEAIEIFEFSDFRETEVYKEILNININKSSGIPEISGSILKKIFKVITSEITSIFNLSVKSSTFPKDWEKATVIPIPKPGDKCKVGNYRPISLLPLPGKLLEKLVHKQLENNLEDIGFFTNFQHGFRKRHSTMHAILQLVNQINYKMAQGIPTTAIFVDFRKVFDSVNHARLLEKI